MPDSMMEKAVLALTAAVFVSGSCAAPNVPPTETVLSHRYGLVALDAAVVGRGVLPGGWEKVRFRFFKRSPYRPAGLEELGELLVKQLEGKGWSMACKNLNALPVFGGPYYAIRARRGPQGAGVLLRIVAPDVYLLEIGPTRPDPPLFDCPPRDGEESRTAR